MKKNAMFYNKYYPSGVFAVLFANFIIIGVFVVSYWLFFKDSNLYHFFITEDGYLEWATTWAFLFASLGCLIGVFLGFLKLKNFQWFYLGLSLFCFLIAMEEISWGQRLIGYKVPSFFLENNKQQEFTAHNFVGKNSHRLIINLIVISYGVLLPILMTYSSFRKVVLSFRFIVPPVELIPSFIFIYILNKTYPLVGTGELVELMLGLIFLFTIVFRLFDFNPLDNKKRATKQFLTISGALLITLGFGIGTVKLTSSIVENDEILIDKCYKELEALKLDFKLSSEKLGNYPFEKNIETRLYNAIKSNDIHWLNEGKFSTLFEGNQGNDKDRANFFIDPWGMAYWIDYRFNKDINENRLIIYSFGPNRKRDSYNEGDDIYIELVKIELNNDFN